MEIIEIGIITSDVEYGAALSEGITNMHRDFVISLYEDRCIESEEGEMQQVLREDLLLIDEENTTEECCRSLQLCKNAVWLTKKIPEKKEQYDGVFKAWKYDRISSLVSFVLYVYGRITGRELINLTNTDAKVFGFTSTEGGVGCTSIALGFAQELRRFYNKRVMYLSLEEIESTGDYMEPFDQGNGLNEYLYHALGKGSGFKIRQMAGYLESFLVFDDYGVEAFDPCFGRNLLTELNADEIKNFLVGILNSGRYDVVILDLGCNISKTALACYDMLEKLCLIKACGSESQREERYMEYIKYLKGEEFAGDIVKLVNKYVLPEEDLEDTADDDEESASEKLTVDLDNSSFCSENGYKKISIDKDFGLGIKEMAKILTGN